MNRNINVIFFIILYSLIYPTNALAYIDPGSGSIILQALIAAFAGASTAITIYWKKLKLFLSKFFKKKAAEKK